MRVFVVAGAAVWAGELLALTVSAREFARSRAGSVQRRGRVVEGGDRTDGGLRGLFVREGPEVCGCGAGRVRGSVVVGVVSWGGGSGGS